MGSLLYSFQNTYLEIVGANIETLLQTMVERDMEPLANEIFDARDRAIKLRLNQMLLVKELLNVTVYNDKGRLLISEGQFGINENLPVEYQAIATSNDKFSQKEWHGHSVIVYLNEIRAIEETIGYIQMVYSIEQIEAKKRFTLILSGGLLLIILLMMIVFLNTILYKTVNLPITNLKKTISEIQTKGPGKHVAIDYHDELGELSEAFNRMSTDLAANLRKIEDQDFQLKKHRDHLEELVEDRTRELEKAHKQLVDEAHTAGMADIAVTVLHNVGNILNSVVTSGTIIIRTVNNSKIEGFVKANELLREHEENLDDFILKDERGKALLKYYLLLEDAIKKENQEVIQQARRLLEKIEMIREVVIAQQTYSSSVYNFERIHLSGVLEDALTIKKESIQNNKIVVERNIEQLPPVYAQKIKLIHIFINLFSNAIDSLMEQNPEVMILKIDLYKERNNAIVRISDNGIGISDENKTRIFSHGFTTKKNGHGYGLHSCANYMTEMGGELWVESEGEGKGAAFVLGLPLGENPSNRHK